MFFLIIARANASFRQVKPTSLLYLMNDDSAFDEIKVIKFKNIFGSLKKGKVNELYQVRRSSNALTQNIPPGFSQSLINFCYGKVREECGQHKKHYTKNKEG